MTTTADATPSKPDRKAGMKRKLPGSNVQVSTLIRPQLNTNVAGTVSSLTSYFDSLVQLVPARFYYDLDAEKYDLKYMKKQQKQMAKAAIKEKGKANKKAKLHPDGKATTLHVQQALAAERKQTASQDVAQQTEGQADGAADMAAAPVLQDTLSKEELRERLRLKIEAFRAQRHADQRKEQQQQAVEWKQSRAGTGAAGTKSGKQRQRPVKGNKTLPQDGQSSAQAATGNMAKAVATATPAGARNKPATVAADAVDKNFKFGAIEVKTPVDRILEEGKPKVKKSKAQLLAEAEAKKAATLAAAAAHSDMGGADDEWHTAVMRARGEKVLDDPKLLRRSVKREARAKQKSREAWQGRVQQQQQRQAAKQHKRTENLQKRSQAKMDKKKVRREKKLLRAGFEGRKSTPISK